MDGTEKRQSIRDWQKRLNEWGDKTFPRGTAQLVFAHLADEFTELSQEMDRHLVDIPRVAEELADLFVLQCQLAGKLGIDYELAIGFKQAKNERRVWAEPDERGVVYHVKGIED